MKKSKLKDQNSKHVGEKGISLVEIIIIIFVATVLLFSISQVAALSFRVSSEKRLEYRAALYLAEGAEALRAMRDESWNTRINPVVSGTVYYFVPTANSWTLSTINPGRLDGVFDRTVVLQNVFRDGADNIAASGTLDTNTRRFTVTASWDVPSRTVSLSTDGYITNYLKN